MFTLDLSPTFEAPVRFEFQAEKGGKRQVVEFTGVFKRYTDDEYKAFTDEVVALRMSDRQVAERVLQGWLEDVRDAAGNPLPFNAQTMARVLNVDGCAGAVVAGFHAARPGAAAGN